MSSFILSSELYVGIGGGGSSCCGGTDGTDGRGGNRGDSSGGVGSGGGGDSGVGSGGIGGSGGVIGGGFKIATAKHCTCVVYALISNVVYLMQDADSNQHLREG